MNKYRVYSKDGSVERCRLTKVEYSGTFMGDRVVTSSFTSATEIAFDVFDYIEFRGEKFELEMIPTVKKVSSYQYEYDLRFVSLKYELERCMFRDFVPNDNEVVYPTPVTVEFTGKVNYLTERIQACLDRMYGAGVWSIVVSDGVDSEEKNLSLSNQNCWNALSLVNTEYKLNFHINGRTVVVGDSEAVQGVVFEYGKGNGLYEIERAADSDTGIVTKLIAYGGTRNLDYSYPKQPEWNDSVLPNTFILSPLRLMLPSFKEDGKTDYLLADDALIAKYGIREGVMMYDDIYPTITGATNSKGERIDKIAGVDAITDEETSEFDVYLNDLGFDLNDSLTTETPQLVMKTGALQGYAFNIKTIGALSNGGVRVTLEKNSIDNSDTGGYYIPNKDFNMSVGDEFVLLGILMPQLYIRNAEQRLEERAREYLNQYSTTNYSYSIGVDEIFMAKNPSVMAEVFEGKKMKINDDEIGINEELVTIQSLTIEDGDGLIPRIKVTLNNNPSASTLERIQGQIANIESTANSQYSAQTELAKQYQRKLNTSYFNRLFVAIDANGREIAPNDTTTPIASVRVNYGLWTEQFLSAKGMNSGGGSDEPTGGATTLGGLRNVADAADSTYGVAKTLILEAESNLWTLKNLSELVGGLDEAELAEYLTNNNYAKKGDIPSLEGYATEQWVLGKGYLTEHQDLSAYAKKTDIPTKVSAFDNDANYATTSDLDARIDALVNGAPAAYDTLKEIADVLSKNVDSIDDILTALGTKVSQTDFDAIVANLQGGIDGLWARNSYDELHVGHLMADTLSAETLLGNLAWDYITGKPTTLDGYGITDAYTKSIVDSKLNLKLDAITFNELFEKVQLEDGTWAIKAKLGLFSDGFISAKGSNVGGTSSEGGAVALYQLNDVLADGTQVNGSQDGAVFVYDGKLGKWKGIAQSEIVPNLTGYATESWVKAQGYLTGITSAMVTGALGYAPYNAANFTKANIKSTLGISDWALASSKPSYTTKEVAEDANLYFTNARAVAALKSITDGLGGDISNLEGYFTNGVANSALRLSDNGSYTAWGQTFFANGKPKSVSGALTDVTTITTSGAATIGGTLSNQVSHLIYDSEKANRLSMAWVNGLSCIYSLKADNSGYNDLRLGVTGNTSSQLYFDASESKWGIGTSTPEYKLDVNGEARVTKLVIGDGTIEWDADNNGFKVTGGLYSTSYISAKGANTNGGSSSGGFLIESLWKVGDLGKAFNTDANDTFNAYAINAIHNRVSVLEGKATNVSFTQSITSGTILGTLTIDGVGKSIYAPTIPTSDINKGVTAYGWGNHASVGYLTSASSLAWGKITGTPTTLSGYGITNAYTKSQVDSALDGYLPLSGGTLTSNVVALTIKRYTANPIIGFNGGAEDANERYGYLGFSGKDRPVYIDATGRTVYPIIHSGNIGSQSVASAAKLTTPRTIWGQSFDGTRDVSGDLSGVGSISRSYDNAVDTDAYGNLQFKSTSATDNWSVKSNSGSYLLYVRNGGNVGIGTTSPSYKLHVNGTLNATTLYQNGVTMDSIVDGYVTALQGRIDGLWARNSFDELFVGHLSADSIGAESITGDNVVATKIQIGDGTIEWDETNNGFKVTGGLYTESYLSAKGANSSGGSSSGGGLITSLYRYADLGKTFSDTSNDTFNAYTINKINSDLGSRISVLEGKATNVTYTANQTSGTLLGTLTIDGASKTIYAPTIPTSLKNPYSLTINNSGGMTQVSYDGSASKSLTLTKAMVGLGSVENTALSSWTGTNKITTLGTITTGVWNGTKIANGYLANSAITIAGTSVSLGGSITAATLQSNLGLGSFAYISSLAFSSLTNKPTTLSGYGITDAYTKSQVDSALGGYLPLSGGTMGGDIYFDYKLGQYTRIYFKDSRIYSGGYADDFIIFRDGDNKNVGSLGLYGDSTGVQYYYIGHNSYNGLNLRIYKNSVNWGENALIHSGNIGSQSVASAAKLTTARTIWGQSFDGTGNVNGALSGVTTLNASGVVTLGSTLNVGGASLFESSLTVNGTSEFKSTLALSNGNYIVSKRSDGITNHNILGLNANNILLINYSAVSADSRINIYGSNIQFSNYESASGKGLMYFVSGNLGIGITPSYKLDVAGVIHSTTGMFSDGYVSAKGQNTSSDMRLKNVLNDVALGVSDIANAPSVRFAWKNGGGVDVGSSAQYWQKLLPDAVKERDGHLEMQYANIALLSAIAIAKRMETHEERIARLEKENSELRLKIERLQINN